MEYEIKSRKGKCLECGDVIEYGRPDRKFCCDNCKNKYNNRHRSASRGLRMKVLSALNRNYTILENLLKVGITSLSVAELQNLGFKFGYVTSFQKIRRHDVHICFDISFTIISDRVVAISKTSVNLNDVSLDRASSAKVRH